jgi:outer membrane protein assembly factor BamA
MRVGQVAIQGLNDIDTATVRRMLSVAPGNVYRERDFFQSQRDLYAMDVFRSVNVSLVDSLAPETSTDSTVRALVRLVEGPRHRIRLGAGYGSVDCFRTQASWSANDFLGGGRTLTLIGRLSKLGVGYPLDGGLERNVCSELAGDETSDTLNYSAGLTLAQPAFISPRHRATIGVFAERRSEIEAYTREAVGFNAGITLNARRTVPVTISWGYSLGRTSAKEGVYCSVFQVCAAADREALASERAFAAITVTAVRDRVNSPLDPTRGSVVTASLVYASRLVGSDSLYEFNRAEFEMARYYPVGRWAVFAWRVRAGTALPQRITLSGTEARYLPPDQRFYAGGPNSVRGYGRNELGPHVYVTTNLNDIENNLVVAPTGGNSVFVMNAELRLPSPVFRQRVRIGVFVDVGQVWERQNELLSFERMRVTPGAGLRFATPLGPVRFDVAFNPYDFEEGPLYFRDPMTNDLTLVQDAYRRKAPRLVYQFAVGQAF